LVVVSFWTAERQLAENGSARRVALKMAVGQVTKRGSTRGVAVGAPGDRIPLSTSVIPTHEGGTGSRHTPDTELITSSGEWHGPSVAAAAVGTVELCDLTLAK
jgi:hypothetical protein